MLKNLLNRASARKPQGKKGFTLVELIVVIVILVILMAIAIPSVMSYIAKANESKAAANAKTAYMAMNILIAEELQKPTPAMGNVDGAAIKARAGVPGTITTMPTIDSTGTASDTFVYSEPPYTCTFTFATNAWTIAP